MKNFILVTIIISIIVLFLYLPASYSLTPNLAPAPDVSCSEKSLNQRTEVPTTSQAYNVTVLVPDNLPYKSANVINGVFKGGCAGPAGVNCSVYVNDVLCGVFPSNQTFSPPLPENVYFFPSGCITSFHNGINRLTYTAPPGSSFITRYVALEMKLCL